ncbi:hypothetical protein [Nocardia nova]|uniref:hypothetical protein n=1 Tax=Nocardia nova TaxID=37330 RepID=UPI0033EE5A29
MTIDFSTTTLDQRRADWVLNDGQITVLSLTCDDITGIDATRFSAIDTKWCKPGGVIFPDGVALAQMRAVLPEYHSLWCAVSEQARVFGLNRLSAYTVRVLRAMGQDGEWWAARLSQEHELSRIGVTRSLNWLCRHGYIVGTGETADTGHREREAIYRLTDTGRTTFAMLPEPSA